MLICSAVYLGLPREMWKTAFVRRIRNRRKTNKYASVMWMPAVSMAPIFHPSAVWEAVCRAPIATVPIISGLHSVMSGSQTEPSLRLLIRGEVIESDRTKRHISMSMEIILLPPTRFLILPPIENVTKLGPWMKRSTWAYAGTRAAACALRALLPFPANLCRLRLPRTWVPCCVKRTKKGDLAAARRMYKIPHIIYLLDRRVSSDSLLWGSRAVYHRPLAKSKIKEECVRRLQMGVLQYYVCIRVILLFV